MGCCLIGNILFLQCGLEATQRIRERGFRKLIVGVTGTVANHICPVCGNILILPLLLGSAMDTETNAFADCGAGWSDRNIPSLEVC